ncbi:uncharacterized protein At2g29880-like [Lotus japonicus]|uniref:uncharacterized protein At2g29880-like n=1 Tax=Lotus japonicus TaxID=34305 RepID=UPI002584CA91|nr:uncharacterized protein At2g29880-like [Lotus japonicus]
MSKSKGQAGEPTQVRAVILRWTEDMDQILLDAFCEEVTKGNRPDGAWTTQGYANVLEALRAGVSPTMTKQNIKNRMKTMKDNFTEAYDLFKGLSGFAWSPMTKRFEAEDHVWEELIKEKPHAIKWKRSQVKHYDTLKELFGADRATGKKALSAGQILREMEKETVDLNDVGDDTSMPEPNAGVFEGEQFSPPNVDSFSPAQAPSHQSTGTSGSRGTKRKTPMIDSFDSQVEKMTSALGLMSDALISGNCISSKLHDVAERQVGVAERQVVAIEERNEIYKDQLTVFKHSKPRIYTESDVWNMLTELNVIDHLRMQCYEFLCTNDQKKRLLFGVPAHMRLQTLFQMMNVGGLQ